MDPNSKHQVWSKWTFVVFPGRTIERDFKEIVANCARFGRKGFGSASTMQVEKQGNNYVVQVLTEGHPVQDEGYVNYMKNSWTKFFEKGFGAGTTVSCTAKLMAGEPGHGGPADQMIILPTVQVQEK